MDPKEEGLLHQIVRRLDAIERFLQSQKPVQDWYTTAEFGEIVERDEVTVRNWCRLRRLNARKAVSGRGSSCEWRIAHAELIRYRNDGLLPLRLAAN